MAGLSYDQLRQHAGRKLGYTGDLSVIEANSTRSADVERALASGLRKFYYGKRARGENRPQHGAHVWTFLQRELTLKLVAGQDTVDLPADFWHMIGVLTFAEGTEIPAIALVDEGEIRSLKSSGSASGDPKYAAVRARDVHFGQQYELLLYPTPDTDRTVTGRYAYEPPKLDDNHPYPAGGALHAETILMGVLCACDEHLNPEAGESLHCQRFSELLEASIATDEELVEQQDGGAWPLDAGGDGGSLCINRDYLDRLIALELQFGPNTAGWTHGHRAEIARVRERALRRVYLPDTIDTGLEPHKWSFLKTTIRLSILEGMETLDLPATVAAIDGPLTYLPGESNCYPPIHQAHETDVRKLLGDISDACHPKYFSVRSKQPHAGSTAAQELVFYPISDGDYVVEAVVRMNPFALPTGKSEPLGCVDLAEVLIAAALCVAAEHAGKPRPDYEKRFRESLYAAVMRDRARQSPRNLGIASPWTGDPDAVRIGEGGYRAGRGPTLVFED